MQGYKLFFWIFVVDCGILLWVGSMDIRKKHYVFISQIATVYYYLFFIILLPVSGLLENYFINKRLYNRGKNRKKHVVEV